MGMFGIAKGQMCCVWASHSSPKRVQREESCGSVSPEEVLSRTFIPRMRGGTDGIPSLASLERVDDVRRRTGVGVRVTQKASHKVPGATVHRKTPEKVDRPIHKYARSQSLSPDHRHRSKTYSPNRNSTIDNKTSTHGGARALRIQKSPEPTSQTKSAGPRRRPSSRMTSPGGGAAVLTPLGRARTGSVKEFERVEMELMSGPVPDINEESPSPERTCTKSLNVDEDSPSPARTITIGRSPCLLEEAVLQASTTSSAGEMQQEQKEDPRLETDLKYVTLNNAGKGFGLKILSPTERGAGIHHVAGIIPG